MLRIGVARSAVYLLTVEVKSGLAGLGINRYQSEFLFKFKLAAPRGRDQFEFSK
jgi:hypothetical protein